MNPMERLRLTTATAFLRARISPEGYLGLQLTLGAAVIIVFAWAFGHIAEDVVTADHITVVDIEVAQWLHGHAQPAITRYVLALTHLHGPGCILAYCVLIAAYLWSRRDRLWLVNLLLAIPGGMSLNAILKQVFHRARPSFSDPLLSLTTYSFPSGHAAGATLLYGFAIAYLASRVASWHWRILGVIAAALMVSAVALSRMYLGVHYLSDVLAAISASGAWLALVLTATSTWRRRYAVRSRQSH